MAVQIELRVEGEGFVAVEQRLGGLGGCEFADALGSRERRRGRLVGRGKRKLTRYVAGVRSEIEDVWEMAIDVL